MKYCACIYNISLFSTFQSFPIVYAIMKGRRTENYIAVLTKVKHIANLQPTLAICDFERAEQNAIKMVFPDVDVMGCFFHYSQVMQNKRHI